jgi:murein DD-endopeptidase MepM/ murein hydrolase activator NlpD
MVTVTRVRMASFVVALWALASLVALAVLAAPAIAQTEPSTTEPDPVTVPTITIPGQTTVPGETTTTDPGVTGDAPPESVPTNEDTIPPREPPASAEVGPNPGRVVHVDTRTARANLLARQVAYDDAVAHRQEVEGELTTLQAHIDELGAARREAVRDLAAAKTELTKRAVDAYVRGDSEQYVGTGADSGARATLLHAVVERDNDAVTRVKNAQAKLSADESRTATALTAAQSALDQSVVDEAQAKIDLDDARLDLAVTSAGGQFVIHGFVFPVANPHTFREDFGDPRLPGTPQAHVHQGCDVVAAEGTELYAAERGVVTQFGNSGLGGNGVWLKGESGTYYYYAHLSAYAPRLRVGQVVDGGTLLGFVGHTGDAYGPHLHFEVHPGGGAAIDPYPILLAADSPLT